MSSGIALTKYIYPLENPIILSSELGYVLDNPRTEQEIELIKNFIMPSVNAEAEKSMAVKVSPAHVRIMLNLEHFIHHISLLPQEEYAHNFYQENHKTESLELLAKSWIIVRFNTILDIDKVLNSSHYLRILSLNNEEKNDYNEQVNKLSSYCQIISLLTINDERIPYIGDSFILNPSHPFEIFFSSINQGVIEIIDRFASNIGMLNPEFKGEHMLGESWWLLDRGPLLDWASKVEEVLKIGIRKAQGEKLTISQKQSPIDKLIHIGGRLKIAHEHINQPELPILLLVGNIEYLLTRNPDTTRFNVEDSISRQFKLKCGVAINEADPSIPLEGLNKKLSDIYSLRSDFAHGNYKVKGDKWELYEVVTDLFKYTRMILIAYINNKALIDYLKDN